MAEKKTLIIAANYEAARKWARHEKVRDWEYISRPEQLAWRSCKDFHWVAMYGWWNNPAAEEWEGWIANG